MANTSVEVTASDPLITTLNLIQLNIGRYLYLIIFILGNIGSILNVLILTQRVYLQNSCSPSILASSIINLFIINIGVLFRLLALGFYIDSTTTSLFFCKFRAYIVHVTTLLSRFYIVLACVDRWATTSTNVRRRAFSQIKVVKILIPLLGIGMCFVSVHILLYIYIANGEYRIFPLSLIDKSSVILFFINYSIYSYEIVGRCVMVQPVYSTFYNIYHTILSGFLTPISMCIFGFLTIQNIKLSRQRVNAQINMNRMAVNQQAGRVNARSREYEILIMIPVQLGVYLIACLPFSLYLIYSTVTMGWTKSNRQLVLDSIYSIVAYILNYINFSATFYIYILTTRVFRKDLKRILEKTLLFKICFGIQEDPIVMRIDNGHPIQSIAVPVNRRAIPNI